MRIPLFLFSRRGSVGGFRGNTIERIIFTNTSLFLKFQLSSEPACLKVRFGPLVTMISSSSNIEISRSKKFTQNYWLIFRKTLFPIFTTILERIADMPTEVTQFFIFISVFLYWNAHRWRWSSNYTRHNKRPFIYSRP